MYYKQAIIAWDRRARQAYIPHTGRRWASAKRVEGGRWKDACLTTLLGPAFTARVPTNGRVDRADGGGIPVGVQVPGSLSGARLSLVFSFSFSTRKARWAFVGEQ